VSVCEPIAPDHFPPSHVLWDRLVQKVSVMTPTMNAVRETLDPSPLPPAAPAGMARNRPAAMTPWLLVGVLGASVLRASAAQFVLFDATFTYSKDDADNSKPSKSHYYIKGDQLNPSRPTDWTSPIDYRNGTVHIRAEVLDKPAGGEPTTWTICYIPHRGQGNGYGCTGTDLYREKGVYEKDVSMKAFWENNAIVWSEGIKQMDLVIKDGSGGGGHAHKRADAEKFFPTRMRITVVQVSAGATYDPKLVPNLPVRDSPAASEKSVKP